MNFSFRARRLAAATCVALAAGLGGASAASADTVAISFTDAAGVSDPAVGVGRTLTVAGNVENPARLYTKVRPAGGAPCAPSFSSDSGTGNDVGAFSGPAISSVGVEGDFSISRTGVWSTPGDFQYCFWLADSSSESVVPITQIVSFRKSNGVISGTVSPLGAAPKTRLAVTVTGNSEAPSNAHAKARLVGAPCAPSYAADSGTALFTGRDVNGPFAIVDTYTPPAAGTYVVCLWIARTSADANPIAVSSSFFDVVAPPPACVVPTIAGGTAPGAAQGALGAANCTLGGQSLTPSTLPRGTVVSTAPAAGTTLPNGAAVALVLSDGPACRVPSAGKNIKLGKAKSKLRAAGCTPGSIKRVRSSRKKGTLVRYTSRAGTTLAPRTKVGLSISRGPRG